MRRDGESGFATVMTLALAMVLLAASSVVVLLGVAAVSRHRAEAGADLAALSGAAQARFGEGPACAAASRVASAQALQLTGCHLDGLDVLVEVSLALPGRLRPFGPVRARAKAGPAGLHG